MLAAVGRTGTQSLYRRFFGAKRHFSESEKSFFLNIDFVNHVALVAVANEGGQRFIVDGGRYIVVRPGTAELAFAVIDGYQGLGIGAALMRHLTLLARAGGIRELIAEALPENIPMLKVLQKSGLGMQTNHRAGVVNVALNVYERHHQALLIGASATWCGVLLEFVMGRRADVLLRLFLGQLDRQLSDRRGFQHASQLPHEIPEHSAQDDGDHDEEQRI
jgi:GNAT superfamily N-acetyltransferase